MKIGILSDTHGNLDAFFEALSQMKNADLILHLGDVLPTYSYDRYDFGADPRMDILRDMTNIRFVRGNGDTAHHQRLLGHPLHDPFLFVELGKYRIFATHGHHYSRMSMLMRAKELNANILCYGHSHIKELDSDDEMAILNPGSTSLPRDGRASYALISDDRIRIFSLEDHSLIAELPL